MRKPAIFALCLKMSIGIGLHFDWSYIPSLWIELPIVSFYIRFSRTNTEGWFELWNEFKR
jgi:hypothetical protein